MTFRWPEVLATPRSRRQAGAILALFIVPALAYALFAPDWYESTMVLMPAQRKAPGIGALLGAGLSADVSSALSGAGPGAERVAAVIQGTRNADGVIAKYRL